jgi:hypothetical protein
VALLTKVFAMIFEVVAAMKRRQRRVTMERYVNTVIVCDPIVEEIIRFGVGEEGADTSSRGCNRV